MPPEGPPQASERKEKEPITDEQAFEAMKGKDLDAVRSWYAQQEARADSEPDGGGRTMLTYRLGRMQIMAGFLDEGLDSLYAAREDAANQRQEALVATINAAIHHAENP